MVNNKHPRKRMFAYKCVLIIQEMGGFLLSGSFIKSITHPIPASPAIRQSHNPNPEPTPIPVPLSRVKKKRSAPMAIAAKDARAIFLNVSSNVFVLSPIKQAATTPITPKKDKRPQLLNPLTEPKKGKVIQGRISERRATPATISE